MVRPYISVVCTYGAELDFTTKYGVGKASLGKLGVAYRDEDLTPSFDPPPPGPRRGGGRGQGGTFWGGGGHGRACLLA